jgi:hypothetical protein
MMTTKQTAIAGAVALNVPTAYWMTQLPAGTAALAAVTLAAIGAGLGALAGFGFAQPLREATALPRPSSHDLERAA